MSRKNVILQDDRTLLLESVRIITRTKMTTGDYLADSEYNFTERAFERGHIMAFKVLSHEIGHNLHKSQGMDGSESSLGIWEYYADWQWWAFLSDLLDDSRFKDSNKNISEAYERAAKFKQVFDLVVGKSGLIEDALHLGNEEHIVARAREYLLLHSVRELDNVEKNNILQGIIKEMVDLQRHISFRALADIHQQLCELRAQGQSFLQDVVRSMIMNSPLTSDEYDSYVLSRAYVDRIIASGNEPVKLDFGQLINNLDAETKGGIDLNADKMDLQLQNGGEVIKFRVDPAMLRRLQDAPGFMPVIINIQPLQDLRLFLGVR